MKKKKTTVSYGPGRIPRFTSPEALGRHLEKVAKGQREAKAKCICEHAREFHTFAPGGESLCDLCGCEKFRPKEREG